MDRAAKISIIVPVYNVEKYLMDCLESIAHQSFIDYELILVDDGSDDNSGAICDNYAELDKRVRVIHQINQGQSSARNSGIEVAQGDWIHFVDSDDIIHPRILEYLYKAATESGVDYCACGRKSFEDSESVCYEDYPYIYKIYDVDEQTAISIRKNYTVYWTPYASIIKSEIVKKYRFQEGKIFEDNAVCFKWIHEARSIVLFDYPMYFYRNNPNGTMNQKFSEKTLDYLWALREQISFYDKARYYRMINVVFVDYIDSSIEMSKKVGEELKDSPLQKRILKTASGHCKKYKTKLEKYDSYIDRLEKRLHPTLHKVKKRVRTLLYNWREKRNDE